MLKQVTLAAALALAGASASAAQAQDAYSIHAGSLEVSLNKSQVVTADRAIDRAMVGNPGIADVLPISDRSIYVLGKSIGTTSLTLYDRTNRVIAVMDISVGPDVEGIRRELEALIPGEAIDARISAGKIILSGSVSDAGAASRAARIAEAFADEEVVNLITIGGSQQVMLEVRFAEVVRSVGETLGARGFGTGNDVAFAIGDGASASGSGDLSVDGASGYGVLSAIFSLGNLDIEAYLDVLERKGLSKTLAEPTLVALSGESASFLAGGEFPIPVRQGDNGGTSVQFKSFGVGLAFTPTVLGDGVINLVVQPEVSSIDTSAGVTSDGVSVPGLQTRRASTTLELRDGESFAIAGLLRQDYQTTVRQLPLLGSIPILGTLFRSTSFQKGETELLIVVTPRLVKPIKPSQVRLPTDRVEDPDVLDTLLAGDDYQPVDLAPNVAPTPTQEDPGYEY
ncbi:type II and III secretion system protein family protein [Croceicoccus naphthovorans]|uniref:Pilus assembly protein CpaC n=1 Tax=Croceicoccus naphthovorans TaxID=1348774 RepID=A0A0G3XFZ1_9SPHN|nr:type II and III secretion system protein family protein [Croceicoccus naphthovorans]AKM09531.1 pilus assembly protein CpaC [Croceicoccus naphthovorans]MBB3989721.1 pilus assembly protein CpaC [Croceicoccus naphthovorans]